MDEEIDDERRARINQYGSDDVYSLRRLKHEIGCRSDSHAEAKAMLEYKSDGRVSSLVKVAKQRRCSFFFLSKRFDIKKKKKRFLLVF